MSLRDLNLLTRRRLRRHAWLLTLWCLAVGFATSWLLLHAFHVRSPAVRYGVSAVFMYGLGLVVGARIWLVQFSRSVVEDAEVLGPATPRDLAAFDSEQRARERKDGKRKDGKRGEGFDWGDLISGALDAFNFDEAAALLLIPALIFAVFGLVFASGALPVMLLDGVAGLLAEVAVQFVFGAYIARRVIRPKSHDDAWLGIVGRTWLAGIALVVASAAAGGLLMTLNPGGASLADLWR